MGIYCFFNFPLLTVTALNDRHIAYLTIRQHPHLRRVFILELRNTLKRHALVFIFVEERLRLHALNLHVLEAPSLSKPPFTAWKAHAWKTLFRPASAYHRVNPSTCKLVPSGFFFHQIGTARPKHAQAHWPSSTYPFRHSALCGPCPTSSARQHRTERTPWQGKHERATSTRMKMTRTKIKQKGFKEPKGLSQRLRIYIYIY